MSGYRSLHRESLLKSAIWSVQATSEKSNLSTWKLWTGSSDGYVRLYAATETSINEKNDELNASALKLTCKNILLGQKKQHSNNDNATELNNNPSLGITQVSIVRNYIGEDDMAGDIIVAALELSGKIRIWQFPEDWKYNYSDNDSAAVATECSTTIKCLYEFYVENATGTTATLAPPRVTLALAEVVVIAVGCLDGTVTIVSTGLATPNAKKEAPVAGTVLDKWGSPGTTTPLCLSWHPLQKEILAVGRQDGILDILSSSTKSHRLHAMNGSPIRAIAYSPDGNLLIGGNDAGACCVWDIQRTVPVLVHHVMKAHKSWIIKIVWLNDSRRFITVGTEQQIHVWNVGQLGQNPPLHTFHLDSTVWTVHILQQDYNRKDRPPRLVTGSDNGSIQVFSLEH